MNAQSYTKHRLDLVTKPKVSSVYKTVIFLVGVFNNDLRSFATDLDQDVRPIFLKHGEFSARKNKIKTLFP